MKRMAYFKDGKPVPTVSVPADLLLALFRQCRGALPEGTGTDLRAIANTLERRATAKMAKFNRSEPK